MKGSALMTQMKQINQLIKSYQKKFSYAADISWEMVMDSVRELYHMSRQ